MPATEQTITFNCPSCQTKLRVPNTMANQMGPCPVCHAMISAPSADPTSKQAPPPSSSTAPRTSASPPPEDYSPYGSDLPAPGSPSQPPTEPTSTQEPFDPWSYDPGNPAQPLPDPKTGSQDPYSSDPYASDPYSYTGQPQDESAPQEPYPGTDTTGYEDPSPSTSGYGQPSDATMGHGYPLQSDYGSDSVQPPSVDSSPYSGLGFGEETGLDRAEEQPKTSRQEPLYAKKRQFPILLAVLFVAVLGGIGFLLFQLDILSPAGAEEPATEGVSPEASTLLPSNEETGTSSGASSPDPVSSVPPVTEDPEIKSGGNNPPEESTAGDPGPSAVTPSLTPEDDESGLPQSKLAAPRKTIQRFLQSEGWQERLPYIYRNDELKGQIEDYHQTHDDSAILDYRLDFFHTEVDEATGYNVYVFFLTFAQDQDGFPLVVIERDDTYGVDWELFVEFRDRHFKTFVEEQRKVPEAFRVVISRVTYWSPDRDQIPDVDSLICYRIDPPYSNFTQHAFVPKDSERGQELLNKLSWQADLLAAEVEMHWEVFPNGRPYLTIDRIVSRTWVKP